MLCSSNFGMHQVSEEGFAYTAQRHAYIAQLTFHLTAVEVGFHKFALHGLNPAQRKLFLLGRSADNLFDALVGVS